VPTTPYFVIFFDDICFSVKIESNEDKLKIVSFMSKRTMPIAEL
jgi:uncharacterized protein YerC